MCSNNAKMSDMLVFNGIIVSNVNYYFLHESIHLVNYICIRDAPIISIGRLLRRYWRTSRMLSCQVVTIGRDVTGVASLAWGGVCGTGGDWSVIDYATQTPSHATALATTYVSIVIPSNTV